MRGYLVCLLKSLGRSSLAGREVLASSGTVKYLRSQRSEHREDWTFPSPGQREGGQQPQLGGPGQPHHGLQVLPDCEAGLVVVLADVEPVRETVMSILTSPVTARCPVL